MLKRVFNVALARDSSDIKRTTLARAPSIAMLTIGAFIVFKAIDVASTTTTLGTPSLAETSLAENFEFKTAKPSLARP